MEVSSNINLKKNTFPIPFNLRSISIPKIPKSQKKS